MIADDHPAIVQALSDFLRARGVDVVGTEAQMAEVDVAVIGRAELQLEVGAGVDHHSKALRTEPSHHAEGGRQPFDLRVEVRHRQGDVIECR